MSIKHGSRAWRRACNLPNPVSEKAKEEERKFLKRWKGVDKKSQRTLWSKLDSDPVFNAAIHNRTSPEGGGGMSNQWGVGKDWKTMKKLRGE